MLPVLATARTVIQGIPMSHIALALSVITFLFVLPAFFDPKKFRGALEEFFGSSNAVIRLAAFLHFLFAFFILNTHWTIKLDSTRSIMTVLGYLLALRGVIWFWFPNWTKTFSRKFFQKESNVYVMAIVGLLFAIGLGYLGLWVY